MAGAAEEIEVRERSTRGPTVVVLHGGPGAPGSAAGLAEELARDFRVLEPLQRRSGGAPLTVARHVDDLLAVVDSRCGRGARPALVGHSWGAMLALAFAAAHPARAAPLALVGCGTFDAAARRELERERSARMGPDAERELALALRAEPDPDARLALAARALVPVDSFELLAEDLGAVRLDGRGHAETWADVLRLQQEGVYPRTFAAIDAPVLMLHGLEDPHPAARIHASLARHLPRLELRVLERCGHYPWLERHARAPFSSHLRAWLARTAALE